MKLFLKHMYPSTNVEIYVYSFGRGSLSGLGLLLCKPKPLHDNQPMFGVTILELQNIQ